MTKSVPFDPTTRCTERDLKDVWKPYAFAEHGEERDAIFGRTEEEYLIANTEREDTLERRDCIRVFKAINFANYNGQILNAMLTVNWHEAGYKLLEETDGAYRKFMNRLEKFMAYRNVPNHYYTVFENSGPRGVHSHICLHVPNRIGTEFRAWAALSLVDVLGKPMPRGQFHIGIYEEEYIYAQWQHFKYCMKGLNPYPVTEEWELSGDNRGWAKKLLDISYKWAGPLTFWENDHVYTLQRVRIARALGPTEQARKKYKAATLEYYQIYDDAQYRLGKRDRGEYETQLEQMTSSDDGWMY